VTSQAGSSTCPVCGGSSIIDKTELGGYQLEVCPRCTLRFAPSAFHASVDYDSVYQSAEYQTEQVQALKRIDGREIAEHPTYRAFFRQVRHVPGTTLLDIGCGVGRFGHGAHAFGWNVTGIDISAVAIAAGQAVAPFPLRACGVDELIEREERFDVITAFEVLEHLSQPVEFLLNAKRLLRPGGQVFCTVPNWESKTVQTSTRGDWLPPIHLMFFSRPALQKLGEVAGLANVSTGVIRTDPLPPRPMAKLRWLTRRIRLQSREPLGLWIHGRLTA
jgi:SAM-dependent methyltransferase